MTTKIFDLIEMEQARQDINIELIASENFVSENVKRALGSCLTNKYAEGYPVGHLTRPVKLRIQQPANTVRKIIAFFAMAYMRRQPKR